MELKNKDIVDAKGALVVLLKKSLPIKYSMPIARLDTKLDEPTNAFAKIRDGLYEKYNVGARGASIVPIFTAEETELKEKFNSEGFKPTAAENKKMIELNKKVLDSLRGFMGEFNELMEQPVTVEFDPIELPDDIEVEPEVLRQLMKFIKE